MRYMEIEEWGEQEAKPCSMLENKAVRKCFRSFPRFCWRRLSSSTRF